VTGVSNQPIEEENVSDTPQCLARAYLSSDDSISANVFNIVEFDSLEYNLGNNFNLSDNSYEVSHSGYYIITGAARVYLTADSLLSIYIRKDGNSVAVNTVQSSTESFYSINIVDILLLEKDSSINMVLFQNTGNNRQLMGDANGIYTYFSIALLES
ncbi:MAG: hypothetical protein ACOC44_16175, partial [Promethearchaeia archaeon]